MDEDAEEVESGGRVGLLTGGGYLFSAMPPRPAPIVVTHSRTDPLDCDCVIRAADNADESSASTCFSRARHAPAARTLPPSTAVRRLGRAQHREPRQLNGRVLSRGSRAHRHRPLAPRGVGEGTRSASEDEGGGGDDDGMDGAGGIGERGKFGGKRGIRGEAEMTCVRCPRHVAVTWAGTGAAP